MNKRELKKRIVEAYEEETPDLCSKILESCSGESQQSLELKEEKKGKSHGNTWLILRRISAVAVCLMLFISGFSVGVFVPSKNGTDVLAETDAVVYIDVNPSVELKMDGQNKVLECIAGNYDAELILSDLNLEGVDMNTALAAIVGSMYVNGYLTEDSNSILVSVDARKTERTEILLSTITSKITDVLKRSAVDCSIIAQSVDVDVVLEERAKGNGVSVGKMHLVDKMVGGIDGYSENDADKLVELPIKELNLIYSTRLEKDGEGKLFDKDVSLGEVGGFLNKEAVLSAIISEISEDITNIEDYEIRAKYKKEEQSLCYEVTLKFKGDKTVYEFEIDCKTGGVIKTDERLSDRKEQQSGEGVDGGERPGGDEHDDGEKGGPFPR